MNEVEKVARAIEDQLTAEDGWMVGTPALSSMCHDFAQAAIAALDEARGDPVARVVAWLRGMKRDDTNWPQHIALLLERGEHLK